MLEKFRKFKKPLQWFLAACCVVYIVSFFVKHPDDLKVLKEISPDRVILLIAVYMTGQLLTSYRFLLVIRKSSSQKLSFSKWFKLFILGRFLNQVVPQAGNLYRSVVLKKEHSITYTQYIASFFAFSWMHICSNLIFGLIVILVIQPDFQIGSIKAVHLIMILIVLGIGIPIVLRYLLPPQESNKSFFSWTREKVSEVLNISVQNLTNFSYMTRFTVLGLLLYCNTIALFYLSFSMFGADVSLSAIALFLVLMTLSNRVIITPGNFGMRELAFGVAADLMNIGMDKGILVSTLIRIVGLLIIITLGTIFGGVDILRNRKKTLS